MADYHPLIARAVAGLEKSTGEARRALYERARTALVAQLRGVVPALEESEITRERLALEEAIRKVEAESARHARETARPTFIKRAEAPRTAAGPARSAIAPQTAVAPRAAPRPNNLAQPRPAAEQAAPEQPARRPVPPAQRPAPATARRPQTLADEALRGF